MGQPQVPVEVANPCPAQEVVWKISAPRLSSNVTVLEAHAIITPTNTASGCPPLKTTISGGSLRARHSKVVTLGHVLVGVQFVLRMCEVWAKCRYYVNAHYKKGVLVHQNICT